MATDPPVGTGPSAGAEYEHIEYKLSLSEWKEAAISLAAFATAHGGTVVFGIGPDGRRPGVQLGKNSLENLANDIKRNTDPPIFPSITVEDGEASAVIRVRTEESPIKPVWAFGRPYKRVGRTNQALSREETLRLVDVTTGHTWDALPCEGLKIEHLGREAVEDFLRRAEQPASTPSEIVVENLRLRLPDARLCNAAALLFAEGSRLPLGSHMQCGLFEDEVGVRFLDEQTIREPVLNQLRKALLFVARNTRKAIRITGRPEREEIPEYPEDAVREAIVNAIVHRDYASAGNVQVRIYPGRMEIWNPGSLPYDVAIEDLYGTHASRPRNRKLADAFHRAGLIEQWGTGTLRIVSACEKRGLPRPEFRYEMGTFIVILESASEKLEPHHLERKALNERRRIALDYVRKHGSITRREYVKLLGVSTTQATMDLGQMVSEGVFGRKGSGRSTRYAIEH